MQTYNRLYAARLTPERRKERNSPYWFLVSSSSMAHKAFVNETSFLRWLDEHGLQCQNLAPGESAPIGGAYAADMHMSHDEFNALTPVVESVTLSNGAWTQAKITEDPQTGFRTVHTLNPNVHTRPIYDYNLMRLQRG